MNTFTFLVGVPVGVSVTDDRRFIRISLDSVAERLRSSSFLRYSLTSSIRTSLMFGFTFGGAFLEDTALETINAIGAAGLAKPVDFDFRLALFK